MGRRRQKDKPEAKGGGDDLHGDILVNDLIIGLDDNYFMDINKAIEQSSMINVNFFCLPLFHPRFRRDLLTSGYLKGPITRSDRVISNSSWISHVVGKISKSIDVDNVNARIQENSEAILFQEASYAQHLGLQSIIIPAPLTEECQNYARCVLEILNSSCQSVLLQLKVHQWPIWHRFRCYTGFHCNLYVCLDIAAENEESKAMWEDTCTTLQRSLQKWYCEPVKAVRLTTACFFRHPQVFFSQKPNLPTSVTLLFFEEFMCLKHTFKVNYQITGHFFGGLKLF